jgi:hypothetical protein
MSDSNLKQVNDKYNGGGADRREFSHRFQGAKIVGIRPEKLEKYGCD